MEKKDLNNDMICYQYIRCYNICVIVIINNPWKQIWLIGQEKFYSVKQVINVSNIQVIFIQNSSPL